MHLKIKRMAVSKMRMTMTHNNITIAESGICGLFILEVGMVVFIYVVHNNKNPINYFY
jgi:hypothetical protein